MTSRSVAKKGQQRLSPLNENTTYLVRVAARNQYGWTQPADIYFSITDGELSITQGWYTGPAAPDAARQTAGARAAVWGGGRAWYQVR